MIVIQESKPLPMILLNICPQFEDETKCLMYIFFKEDILGEQIVIQVITDNINRLASIISIIARFMQAIVI